jgi:hypothetical protein
MGLAPSCQAFADWYPKEPLALMGAQDKNCLGLGEKEKPAGG